MADAPERPDCLHCRHYFVTWEPAQPRGCRAFGFKSVELPAMVVLSSSGEACRLFERRTGPAGPNRPQR